MKLKDFIVSTCAFSRNSLEFALDSIANAGFDKIQLWGQVAHFHPEYINDEDANILSERIRGRGIILDSFFPEGSIYPFNPASPDPEIQTATKRYYHRCIQLCSIMGISTMIVTPGSGLIDRPESRTMDTAADVLAAIALDAREQGVELALLHSACVHLGSFAKLKELRQRLGDAVGIVADAGLLAAEGSCIEEALRSENGVIRIHLADGMHEHLAFGDGEIPLEETCSRIAAAGFADKTILVLNNRRYVLHPEKALMQTAEAICKWL